MTILTGSADRVALAFDGREYTHAELESLAARMAGDLGNLGVRAGERVAARSSSQPDFVIAMLAVWRLNAAVVLFEPGVDAGRGARSGFDIARSRHPILRRRG
ncbi:AMP-binding protein [Nocardia vinacea]|uniref:AMP-binding protein n=1 Tax=Nocardia vinacea TaxID=96468 RepID=UPI0009FC2386|nr:AMP-binding protein [Nocardia vinacea]